ncbi:MAG: WG repeat-containing protein [Bernardetiaceae bacterium]|nr:WG repeat-containing protein [Bernardetiaceae bacterium]
MNWQDIKISPDNKSFWYKGKMLFDRIFIDALKFHSPGFAAVQDDEGSYHIDTDGKAIYVERYDRTFGFYCNRATVVKGKDWFHLTEKSEKAYSQIFSWCGNYQESLCTVRDNSNRYFHIDLWGSEIYTQKFIYAGDYKDGFACVRLHNGFYKHIDIKGNFLNNKEFYDLGVFHKNFAAAKDQKGWFHIDKNGNPIYSQRYQAIEPFYNGFAVADTFEGKKQIIDEQGKTILVL